MDVDTEEPVIQPDEDDLAELTAKNSREWCKRWLGTSKGQKTAIQRWEAALRNYHFCIESPEVSKHILF
jgi:hypothetical protein